MIDVILTIGVINGLTLAVALFTIKNGNPRATKVFGLIVLLISLMILESLLIRLQVQQVFPYFLRSTDGFLLIVLPALYFYALVATETKSNMEKLDWMHLLPFLLFTFWLIPDYLSMSDAQTQANDPQETAILGYIKGLSAIVYFPLSIGHIVKFRKSTKRQLPAVNLRNVEWFYYTLISLFIIGITSLGIFTLEVNNISIPGPDSDTTAGILLTLAFHINGLVLIRNPYILWGPEQIKSVQSQDDSSRIKYRTSPLSSSQLQEYLDQLIFQMEHQKVYRNPELELKQLEEVTGIRSYYITEVTNTLLGQNFYEFVNAYRIAEVKDKLTDPANEQKTVLSLAFEVGFNSKSSFNRVFKLYTGKSPTHYRREKRKKS